MPSSAPETLRLLLAAKQFSSQRKLADLLRVTAKTVRRWEKGEVLPSERYLPALREIVFPPIDPLSHSKSQFTFIDLFAGIGGMRKGFESIGGRCVFTSEWNRFCLETYRENFECGHTTNVDITEQDKRLIPEHDVLLAGFPCQPFSIAGVSKKKSLGRKHGFEDETQGTLFFEIVQVLKEKRPAAFLLENVKNLVSHDKGRTFHVIIESLKELGYTVGDETATHRIIDAQHFVPQHRERTFIVGFREATGFAWSDLVLPANGEGPRLSSILHPENGTEEAEEPFTEGPNATVAKKYTLTDKLGNYLQNYAEKHRAKGNGFGFGLVNGGDVARTLSARYYKDGSEILVSRGEGKNPRRLTPRECARLMGFDDEDSTLAIPVSDTQAYKQLGNAVAVPVVKAVARIMRPHILALAENRTSHQLSLDFG